MTERLRPLFIEIEELRLRARLSQLDVATLIGVTRRTYVSWSLQDDIDIHSHRESDLQYTKLLLELGIKEGRLPIEGHDRRPATAALRREVIRDLPRDFPVNPFSLSE